MVLTVAAFGASCAKSGSSVDKSRKDHVVPVTVAAVIQKDVPLALDTFGRAQSKANIVTPYLIPPGMKS